MKKFAKKCLTLINRVIKSPKRHLRNSNKWNHGLKQKIKFLELVMKFLKLIYNIVDLIKKFYNSFF